MNQCNPIHPIPIHTWMLMHVNEKPDTKTFCRSHVLHRSPSSSLNQIIIIESSFWSYSINTCTHTHFLPLLPHTRYLPPSMLSTRYNVSNLQLSVKIHFLTISFSVNRDSKSLLELSPFLLSNWYAHTETYT